MRLEHVIPKKIENAMQINTYDSLQMIASRERSSLRVPFMQHCYSKILLGCWIYKKKKKMKKYVEEYTMILLHSGNNSHFILYI